MLALVCKGPSAAILLPMPPLTVHQKLLNDYMTSMLLRDVLTPRDRHSVEQALANSDTDMNALLAILLTRYPNGRDNPVPKEGNIHLAWRFSQNPAHHHRFVQMLRVSPQVFDTILTLIEEHPVFVNNSNNSQAPVEQQLAVTLLRMGRYGNGAAVEDIARQAGISEGSVEKYTERVFDAIESLHDLFVRQLTPAEKEAEKRWMDEHLGFRGTWREGWVMYDGTIVVLYKKPGLNGDAYYTRKGNYGLNAQIGNTPSNLRIVDYSHGMTGSAHDAAAFEHTTAAKYPDWFFDGDEFAWADSAYAVNSRTIPVHKQPASNDPCNAAFDKLLTFCLIMAKLKNIMTEDKQMNQEMLLRLMQRLSGEYS
ncbi:hypothetical protein NLJ89_g7453 [Agrocybe chaxingu]|uniref:DDE Tnp4 domain-containing protein n=1 Tax=Agrocybe chaxingu TaxID=84603 RepID=A0A9W8MRR6_9AGAR|nr:hypothetical protein NLJ89_g7453 [Agrocybe chaxingu]